MFVKGDRIAFFSIPGSYMKLIFIVSGGILLALAIMGEHYGLLATLALLIFVGIVYFFRSLRLGLTKSLQDSGASIDFMVVAITGILGLNLLALSSKDYSIHQVLASILLCISVYPFWRYLRHKEGNIPFVPLIAMVYGIYYGIFVFLLFEYYSRLVYISNEVKTKALLLTDVGLCVLLITFYKWPQAAWKVWLPQLSIRWSETRARRFAIVLGIVGLTSVALSKLMDVPLFVAQFIYFLNQLGLLAIVILFFLQLNGKLQLPYKLFLWGALVPLQLLMDIGAGTLFQPIRFGVMFGMTYVLVKQKVPWRLIVILSMLAFPLLATKGEFRSLTWKNSSPMQEDPIRRGVDFLSFAGFSMTRVDKDSLYVMAEVVAQRLDLLSFFGFVIERTPNVVPYWGGETYSTFLWRFIPRIFVPDKPMERLGQEVGHRYGLLDLTDIGTSVNLAQLVEMYANFGTIGVIVGMFALGLVYSVLQYSLNHKKAGEWGQVSSIIIFISLINIESNFTIVYGGIIYWIVLLWFLGWFVRSESSPLHLQGDSISSFETARK
jgi:hypothetical protein